MTNAVVLTSQAVSTPGPDASVHLVGLVQLTTGASVTEVMVRINQWDGGIGPQVGNTIYITAAANTIYTIPFDVTDTPGEVAGLEYTVSVQGSNATTNGTVHYAVIGGVVY